MLLRPLKWYKSLEESKCRIKEGYFLIEGKKAVEQLFQKNHLSIEEILVSDDIKEDIGKFNVPYRRISATQLHSISSAKTPQGIIALVKLPEGSFSDELPSITGDKILLLEHVQDPGNVGTLIRTAAAFNYSGVILSNQCADPFSSKVVQATCGSLFSLWLRRTTHYQNMLKILQMKNFKLLAADVDGEPHIDFALVPKHVVSFGSEGLGLSKEIIGQADIRFSIPFNSDNVESLNVAVCGGVVMFCGMSGGKW